MISLRSFIKKILPTGSFARGFTLLAGSNVIGQVLALAASPILTRLYQPSDFGVLAIYMSITVVIAVLMSARYENAIALPETDVESLHVALLSIAIVLVNTSICSLLVVLFGHELANLFKMPELEMILWFLPLSMFLLGVFNVFRFWAVRKGNFSSIGVARIWQVVSSLFVQIVFFKYTAFALIGGQVANQGAGSFRLGREMFRSDSLKEFDFKKCIQVAKRYKRFPLISTWAALLNRFSSQLPTILFALFFGPVVAGLYALSVRVVNTPAGVMSGALGSVFLASAVKEHREGDLANLCYQTHKKLSSMMLPPLLFVAVIAPEVFEWVFGSEWRQSGVYSQWIVILVYFAVVASPLMQIFSVLEKQTEEFVFQVVLFTTRGATILAGAWSGSSLAAIAFYSVGSGLCYMLFLIWLARHFGKPIGYIMGPMMKSAVAASLLCAPALIVFILDFDNVWKISTALFSGLLISVYSLKKIRQ